MYLKILSWNSRSLQGKMIELRRHLETNFYHIILVQETWLNAKVSINLPNFTCLRKDRESNSRYPHGGVLIFVHSSVSFKTIDFTSLDYSESVFIRIPFLARELVIGSIYYSCSLKCKEKKLDFMKLFSRPGPFILAGDFNAKHSDWNNIKNDRNGMNLRKICEDNVCEIHFTDKPTIDPPVGPPSFLDLAISKRVIGISKP
jgi:exonuclease III